MPERFWMPSALLWAYSAENLFYNCNSGKSADFPELLFHRWVVEENSIYSAAFCESAALWRGYLFAFSILNPLRLTFVRQLPRRGSFLQ